MSDGLVWVERKLIGDKKARAFAMRKSRAKLDERLTNAMRDAERDIERAFRYALDGNGYPTGGQGGAAESFYRERDIELYCEYSQWKRECDKDWANAVLDISVFGDTARALSERHGCSPNTVLNWFCKGLNEYCVQRGWGDQFSV